MLIRYDPRSRQFSKPVAFGKPSSDHHHCPIVWADEADHLHVLYGCHKTPGTHLIAKRPDEMSNNESDWIEASDIAPGLSYPTVFRIYENKEVIYYQRTVTPVRGRTASAMTTAGVGRGPTTMSPTWICTTIRNGLPLKRKSRAEMASICTWCSSIMTM